MNFFFRIWSWQVEAKKAVPRQDMNRANNGISGADNSKVKKIFVGGLAPTVDEKAFREYFQQYGDVEDAVVMYDPHSSRPRGFGFVTFESEESVDNVFLHGVMQELHEKQIEIKRAVPREEMVPPRRTRPAHGGAGFVPPHRSAPHVSKQSYSISPPQQQQLLGSAGWSQQGYYNQSAATVQHQQTAAVASSRMQQATQDHMYSSLTAGLAAARSLSISNGINALMGNGNNLPSSIDLGALDLGGIDSSHMGFAQDTGFGNHQINAPSPGSSLGGLPQVYGSFPDRALSNEAGYSSSFSGGGSYGLGFGFQGGNL